MDLWSFRYNDVKAYTLYILVQVFTGKYILYHRLYRHTPGTHNNTHHNPQTNEGDAIINVGVVQT